MSRWRRLAFKSGVQIFDDGCLEGVRRLPDAERVTDRRGIDLVRCHWDDRPSARSPAERDTHHFTTTDRHVRLDAEEPRVCRDDTGPRWRRIELLDSAPGEKQQQWQAPLHLNRSCGQLSCPGASARLAAVLNPANPSRPPLQTACK